MCLQLCLLVKPLLKCESMQSPRSMHAVASAEAYALHCNCANAEAWTFGHAHRITAICADADALAEAESCVAGAFCRLHMHGSRPTTSHHATQIVTVA